MIAEVIHEDTGLPDGPSRLLAVSLVGMAQVSARFWLTETAGISQSGRRGARRRARLARDPRLPPGPLTSGPSGYGHHTPPSYT